MIKIIAGTYGYYNGCYVEPKTEKDAPFCLTAEQEKRLVDKGVAVYVEIDPPKAKNAPEGEIEPQKANDAEEVMTKKELNAMKMDDLKEKAEIFGVRYKVGMKKTELVDLIIEASQDDGEEFPDIDPQDCII